jgi:hypothetical protein
LDGKAGNLIGFVSVVVSVLLGSALFELRALSFSHPVSILYFIGIGILLLSIGLALGGFRVKRWTEVPNVNTILKEDYINAPYLDVLQKSATAMAEAVKDAERQNNQKAKLIDRSWYFLIAGLTLAVLFIILFIASGAEFESNGS